MSKVCSGFSRSKYPRGIKLGSALPGFSVFFSGTRPRSLRVKHEVCPGISRHKQPRNTSQGSVLTLGIRGTDPGLASPAFLFT